MRREQRKQNEEIDVRIASAEARLREAESRLTVLYAASKRTSERIERLEVELAELKKRPAAELLDVSTGGA